MISRFRRYGRLLVDSLMVPVVLLMPRNRKKVLFGAWSGHQYSCNSKYLFENLVSRGDLRCYWVGDAQLSSCVLSTKGARFVRKGSLAALWHALTASWYVCNIQWRSDIINIPHCGRVNHIYLTHGVADKKMGSFQYKGNGPVAHQAQQIGAVRRWLSRCCDRWLDFLYGQKSWCSTASKQSCDIYVENLVDRLTPERMLSAGTPRGDFMIRAGKDSALRQQLRTRFSALLGLPIDKKWYVFVPTWRHEPEYLYSFTTSRRRMEFEAALERQNAVLIEKQHPITLETLGIKGGAQGRIWSISSEQARMIDTQELLVACDVLITDYSSVYYDFVLMNRPVMHFIYDFDHFMNKDMGFCFDIRDYGGGPFASTEGELLDCFEMSDVELLAKRNSSTVDVQLAWEKGISCDAYHDLIVGDKSRSGGGQ